MCLAQWPQRSEAGEARARGALVSSQALYHWATALHLKKNLLIITQIWIQQGHAVAPKCFAMEFYKGIIGKWP